MAMGRCANMPSPGAEGVWVIQCRLPLEQPEPCVTPGTTITGDGLILIILG